MIYVTRRYHFEAAHFLPKVPDGHKCKGMHGHNYEIEVTVAGDVDDVGFVIDFWDLDKVVAPMIEKVDHKVLNEVPGLGNPTAELIGRWFAERLAVRTAERALPQVTRVRVYETKDCWADVYVSPSS